MSIQDDLYTKIKSVSGITALIGSGDNTRFYPLIAPNSAYLPYVTFQRISSEHLHHQTASAGLAHALFQFDIYAATGPSADAIAQAFRAGFDGLTTATWTSTAVKRVLLENQLDLYEAPEDGSEKGVHRIMMSFDIWFAESVPAP